MEILAAVAEVLFTPRALVALLLVVVSVYFSRKRPKNFPPGPRGLPVVGILPFLGDQPEEKFWTWSKKYGSVLAVRMALDDFVILNDFECITEALVKNKELFSGRPQNEVFLFLGDGVGFADYTPAYKTRRKFGMATLREFGVGKKSMEERVIEEVRYLNQSIQSQGGRPFDILDTLGKAISNNICSVTFGRRFEYSDPNFARMILLLTRSLTDPDLSRSLTIIRFASWLQYFPPFSGHIKQFRDDISELRVTFGDIINEHKATLDKGNPRDFIDKYLMAMEDDTTGHFSEDSLMHYCYDLFVGGTETSTSTLRWALVVMLHNPETQKKLRREIVSVLGHDGTATMSDRSRMPYTNAFIEELNRYRTLLPLSIMHKTSGKVNINGYDIPKDTTVLPNLWAVHNDPSIWKNSDKFEPERHLDANGEFVKSKFVIPFSLGGRRCLGEQLAKTELFLFLVSIVQRFSFRPGPEGLPSLVSGSNSGVTIPSPFEIVAEEL